MDRSGLVSAEKEKEELFESVVPFKASSVLVLSKFAEDVVNCVCVRI